MTRTAESGLFTGYSGRILLVVSVGFMTLQAGRLVIPPLLPAIIEEFAITEFTVGVALSVMWGFYAMCQYLSGRLSDALTRKSLLVVGLSLMAVGFVVLGSSPNYVTFVLGLAVVGFGAGLYPTAAYALVSELFVERRGNAIGFYTSGADIGGVIAAGLAIAALSIGIWRTAFLPVLAAALVTALALHAWSREPYRFSAVSLDLRASVERLTTDRQMLALLFGYSFYMVTWQGFTSFLPAFLGAEKSFPIEYASGAFAVLFLVGAITKPTAGWLSDRVHRLYVAFGAVAVGVASLAMLLVVTRLPAVMVAVVGFSVGLMAFPPVMQSHLIDVFPDANRGSDLGTVRTVYMLVGSLGPSITGYLANRYSYAVAFGALLVALSVTGAVVLGRLVARR